MPVTSINNGGRHSSACCFLRRGNKCHTKNMPQFAAISN